VFGLRNELLVTDSMEKPADLILAIDFGTQSVRALAYEKTGHCAATCQIPVRDYRHPAPGWSEHDVSGFWDLLVEACLGLWAKGVDAERVAGLVVTTQRATVINLDAAGEPLRPAIIWTDQRRASIPSKLPWYWRAIFGLLRIRSVIDNFEAEAEANWLAQHQPEVLAKTAHYLLLSGYLNYRLTDRYADSIGSQVGYLPFDFKKHDWCADADWKWHSVALSRDVLPELVRVGDVLGGVTERAARATGLPVGAPVIAGAADKACEVLGVGANRAGVASVSCGTTATINTHHARYVEVVPFMPAYPAAVPAEFNTEVQVFRGFWMVSWFLDQFAQLEQQQAAALGVAPESLLDDLLMQTSPGAEGLLLQPFWNPVLGETGPEGRGSIIGFKDFHTRAHVYRALVEGIAFALRAGRERIESRTKTPIRQIRVSGGGAQSDQVMQILANVFGLPVERFDDCEASGRGAAMIGASTLGWFTSVIAASDEMRGETQQFVPDPAIAQEYEHIFRERYRPLYARLRPLFLSQVS